MTIRPPLPDDTYCAENAPDTNYVTSQLLSLGRGSANKRRAFLKFDLSSERFTKFPILTAHLRLYWSAIAATAYNFTIARCVHDWQPIGITWNNYAGGTPWTNSDIEDAANYDETYAYTAKTPAVEGFQAYSIKDLVEDAINNQGEVLNIALYIEAGTSDDYWSILSGQYVTVPGWRPALLVQLSGSGYFHAAATGQVHPSSGW